MDRYELILEARKLVDRAIIPDTGEIDRNLLEIAINHGWERIGSGAFKVAVAKGPIVLKFPYYTYHEGSLEVEGEARQYREGPLEFMTYLTPLYDNYKGALIQERVQKCEPGQCRHHDELGDLHEKFSLSDTWGNHGHLDGKLKFHDWVFRLGGEP